MEYRNIITFLRVAELQNFTQAANSLGYAQSTVTFHIQSLEEELGIKLFDRIGKKISLTIAGEYLISYANEIMHIESEIKQLYKKLDNISGTLRIGVVESLLSTYVEKAILLYRQKFPNVFLEIRTASTLELMELLESNDVDIILIIGKRIVDHNFIRSLIKPEKIFFVTSSSNKLVGKDTVSFQEVAEQPLILPEKASFYRQIAEEVAAQFDCILAPAIQVNNTATIIRLLKEGMGISFLPNYLIAHDVATGELSPLNIVNDHLQNYYIQILYHKNKWVTPHMKGFTALMKEIFSV